MPHNAACNRLSAYLSAYMDSELPADQCATLHAHLVSCPACAAELAALQKTARLLQQLPATNISPVLLARLHTAVDSSSRKPLERFVGILSGIAACLALFAGLMLFRPAAAAPLAAPALWESNASQLPDDSFPSPLANSQESTIGQWMVANLSTRGD